MVADASASLQITHSGGPKGGAPHTLKNSGVYGLVGNKLEQDAKIEAANRGLNVMLVFND